MPHLDVTRVTLNLRPAPLMSDAGAIGPPRSGWETSPASRVTREGKLATFLSTLPDTTPLFLDGMLDEREDQRACHGRGV